MLEEQVDSIRDLYETAALEMIHSEFQSAPSGEWEEYNHHAILAESQFYMMNEIVQILNINVSDIDEKVGIEDDD